VTGGQRLPFMIPPPGEYHYEIVNAGRRVAIEDARLAADTLSGTRKSAIGGDRYDVQAQLDADSRVVSIEVRYTRGPFSRTASYRVDGEAIRGSVSALAARNAAEAKLGRFREVDAGLVVFKALVIAHARGRGQTRFIGRVATVDPDTLVVSSRKQTYRQIDADGRWWIFEPSISESEEIELDAEGRVIRRVDARGNEAVLKFFAPP
jgi:hypothetical protein